MAATLGYDGVEVMVWTDAVSQDAGALRGLVRALRRAGAVGARALPAGHPAGVEPGPVGAAAPRRRARRDAGRADRRGAPAVHLAARLRPQLRRPAWPGSQAGTRTSRSRSRTCTRCGWPGASSCRTLPGWDPTEAGFDAYTLDLSHCAASRSDALEMADTMGDGLAHVHLGDGTGEGRDEHLVPGRGNQPCAELLRLAGRARASPGSVARGGGHPQGDQPRGPRGRPGRGAGVRPRTTWRRRSARRRRRAGDSAGARCDRRCGVAVAARLRARWAATCERVAQRSEQNRRQQFDEVSR